MTLFTFNGRKNRHICLGNCSVYLAFFVKTVLNGLKYREIPIKLCCLTLITPRGGLPGLSRKDLVSSILGMSHGFEPSSTQEGRDIDCIKMLGKEAGLIAIFMSRRIQIRRRSHRFRNLRIFLKIRLLKM